MLFCQLLGQSLPAQPEQSQCNKTVKRREDVEKHLGLNLLGQIPNKQDAGRGKRYYARDASGQ